MLAIKTGEAAALQAVDRQGDVPPIVTGQPGVKHRLIDDQRGRLVEDLRRGMEQAFMGDKPQTRLVLQTFLRLISTLVVERAFLRFRFAAGRLYARAGIQGVM